MHTVQNDASYILFSDMQQDDNPSPYAAIIWGSKRKEAAYEGD